MASLYKRFQRLMAYRRYLWKKAYPEKTLAEEIEYLIGLTEKYKEEYPNLAKQYQKELKYNLKKVKTKATKTKATTEEIKLRMREYYKENKKEILRKQKIYKQKNKTK